MHLPRQRRNAGPVPAPAPTPRYETVATPDGRTDLYCTTCTCVMAYDVSTEQLAVDAPFFLDAHRPFCGSGRAVGRALATAHR